MSKREFHFIGHPRVRETTIQNLGSDAIVGPVYETWSGEEEFLVTYLGDFDADGEMTFAHLNDLTAKYPITQ